MEDPDCTRQPRQPPSPYPWMKYRSDDKPYLRSLWVLEYMGSWVFRFVLLSGLRLCSFGVLEFERSPFEHPTLNHKALDPSRTPQ